MNERIKFSIISPTTPIPYHLFSSPNVPTQNKNTPNQTNRRITKLKMG